MGRSASYLAVATILSLTCWNSAMAQVSYFGFKGGLNVSTIGSEESGFTTRLGYNVGFYAAKQYFQELGLQTELLISYQGARSETVNDLKLNYTYLTLPVFANIYFQEGMAMELGAQFGYLLRAIEYDGGNKTNIRDNVNNFDFAGIIGFSYTKHYGSAGFRYVLGVTNVNGASIAFNEASNKVLQFYIAKTLVYDE